MNNKISHNKYYEQFGKHLINLVSLRIGLKRIQNSKCKHFNDIPLKEWDMLEISVRNQVGLMLREANGKAAGVSLSDCVCVAKSAARIIRAAHRKAKRDAKKA